MQALLIILGLLFAASVGGGLYWLLRVRGLDPSETGGPELPPAAVPPQKLSSLAQPYRNLLGEAVAIQQEVTLRSRIAPFTLKTELADLSQRMNQLVLRALPRAEHGTELSAYLLRLKPDEAEFAATSREAERIDQELRAFLEQLKRIRGRVYAILSSAANLKADPRLQADLAGTLADMTALEEALAETVQDMQDLS